MFPSVIDTVRIYLKQFPHVEFIFCMPMHILSKPQNLLLVSFLKYVDILIKKYNLHKSIKV